MCKLLQLPGVVVMALGGLFAVWSWELSHTSEPSERSITWIGVAVFAAGAAFYRLGAYLGRRFWPRKDRPSRRPSAGVVRATCSAC